jgi:hypothetical protein
MASWRRVNRVDMGNSAIEPRPITGLMLARESARPLVSPLQEKPRTGNSARLRALKIRGALDGLGALRNLAQLNADFDCETLIRRQSLGNAAHLPDRQRNAALSSSAQR